MKIKSRNVIKTLLSLLFIVIAFLLQSMVFSRLQIFGSSPLLLPLAVAAIALSDGSIRGGWFGLVAGILCDISFNQPTIQFTVCLALAGIGIGLMAENFLIKNFTSYVLCSLAVLLFFAVWQCFTFVVFERVSFFSIFGISLLQTLASVIFTPVLYYFFKLLNNKSLQ